MAQQLGALVTLAAPTPGCSQQPGIPVPGNSLPPSGLHRFHTHVAQRHTETKVKINLKKTIKIKLICQSTEELPLNRVTKLM